MDTYASPDPRAVGYQPTWGLFVGGSGMKNIFCVTVQKGVLTTCTASMVVLVMSAEHDEGHLPSLFSTPAMQLPFLIGENVFLVGTLGAATSFKGSMF